MTAELKKVTGLRESVFDAGGSETVYDYVTPDEATMREWVRLMFEEHWDEIVVGPCIEGAVFELRFEEKPKKVTISDGYLTVDLGYWHFHLCVGEHKNAKTPEIARRRRVSKMAFFETKSNGCVGGSTYGMKMWNGAGEQMTTVFLPNPRLSSDMKVLKEPNWEHLRLWFDLRNQFLGKEIPASFVPEEYLKQQRERIVLHEVLQEA